MVYLSSSYFWHWDFIYYCRWQWAMGRKVWAIRFCWTIRWDVAGIYWRRWRRVRGKKDNLGGRTSCTIHHILAWAYKGIWQPVPNESLCNSVWWLAHGLGDKGLFSGRHFFPQECDTCSSYYVKQNTKILYSALPTKSSCLTLLTYSDKLRWGMGCKTEDLWLHSW